MKFKQYVQGLEEECFRAKILKEAIDYRKCLENQYPFSDFIPDGSKHRVRAFAKGENGKLTSR